MREKRETNVKNLDSAPSTLSCSVQLSPGLLLSSPPSPSLVLSSSPPSLSAARPPGFDSVSTNQSSPGVSETPPPSVSASPAETPGEEKREKNRLRHKNIPSNKPENVFTDYTEILTFHQRTENL